MFCSRIQAQNLCSMKAIHVCQRVAAAAGLCFNRVLSLYWGLLELSSIISTRKCCGVFRTLHCFWEFVIKFLVLFESCLISAGHFVSSYWFKLAFSFKLIGRLVSYSSSGGGLNLIHRLFQTVSELKRYICSQYVEMEHTLAEKRRNLLRYTPKPHSRALNDVIMHNTHYPPKKLISQVSSYQAYAIWTSTVFHASSILGHASLNQAYLP